MTDYDIKMRESFLAHARPTLRSTAKVYTTEDWTTTMDLWFDQNDRALWRAFEAGWATATKLLLDQTNQVMFNRYQLRDEGEK